eukprot:gnl/MRDRNA2_/MRDRNA2_110172_c0_seq1.p1 gnl/MRDRNA2_/MRDRNA2_110172_c0~~gnl/MRDRNA2_/MRDRNA2_110172_c0_seq1.p1  ORF type:complete len:424 (-),score=104.41 gnl/MRDRNA2_/MRDRNA2_110172_c0_seq1:4-1275(-)
MWLERGFRNLKFCGSQFLLCASLFWRVESSMRQPVAYHSPAPVAAVVPLPQVLPTVTPPCPLGANPTVKQELDHSKAENKWLRRELERFLKPLPPAGAPTTTMAPPAPAPVPAPAAVPPGPAPLSPLAPAPPPVMPLPAPAPAPAPAPNPWEVRAENAQLLTDAEAAHVAKEIATQVSAASATTAGTSVASGLVPSYEVAGSHLASAVAGHLVSSMPMGCPNCEAYAETKASFLFKKAIESKDLQNKVTALAVQAAKSATKQAAIEAAQREADQAVELGGWERALTHYLEEYMSGRLEDAMEPINDELRRAARQTARMAVYGGPPSPSPAPGPVAPVIPPFSVRNAAWRIAQATNYGLSPAAPPAVSPVPAPMSVEAPVPSPAPAPVPVEPASPAVSVLFPGPAPPPAFPPAPAMPSPGAAPL